MGLKCNHQDWQELCREGTVFSWDYTLVKPLGVESRSKKTWMFERTKVHCSVGDKRINYFCEGGREKKNKSRQEKGEG